MEARVCAVTVTYGNRFHLLKQVIDAALDEGVYKIIVVDNNSESESRKKLIEYERALNGKIKVLYQQNPPLCFSCKRKLSPEKCIFCQKIKPVFERLPQGPVCKTCFYLKVALEKCVICGKVGRVALRTEKGPICNSCYFKLKPKEVCIICKREGRVAVRTPNGPICHTCYYRDYRKNRQPKYLCSICTRLRIVAKWDNGKPICDACYHKLKKRTQEM